LIIILRFLDCINIQQSRCKNHFQMLLVKNETLVLGLSNGTRRVGVQEWNLSTVTFFDIPFTSLYARGKSLVDQSSISLPLPLHSSSLQKVAIFPMNSSSMVYRNNVKWHKTRTVTFFGDVNNNAWERVQRRGRGTYRRGGFQSLRHVPDHALLRCALNCSSNVPLYCAFAQKARTSNPADGPTSSSSHSPGKRVYSNMCLYIYNTVRAAVHCDILTSLTNWTELNTWPSFNNQQ
jgi:hypothetical protein